MTARRPGSGDAEDNLRTLGQQGELDPDLRARVTSWIADDPDPTTAAEAGDLLRRADRPGDEGIAAVHELADRFSGLLLFGTAGLRGALGAGPHRMNRAVVIRAAAALHGFLADALGPGAEPPRLVVGYDARHRSADFARDTVAVVTAAGGRALLLPAAAPTPVLAFAVRYLHADAGVMVTASHNPAWDNGYKVYLGGRVATGPAEGVQLVPPADEEIAARMRAIPAVREVPRADEGWQVLDSSLEQAYLERVALGVTAGSGSTRVVVTPLHGVGGRLATAALSRAGLGDVRVVAEQARPDPAFPTVAFPNPEEPRALDLAIRTATSEGAHLVLALDPDADRCAVAIPDPVHESGWRRLTGDEVGALLGQEAARAIRSTGAGEPNVLASSVVSSRLLAQVARAHGLPHVTTLTGFKWIARVPHLAFGYEEALGYCVDPDTVRDKDGIAAAVRVAALVDRLADRGQSLATELDALAVRHGLHLTDQVSLRTTDLGSIARTMTRLRAAPPHHLAGAPVAEVVDLAAGSPSLPPTDALVVRTAVDDRVVVRPSGTEPKLKCYLEVVEAVPGGDLRAVRERAAARMAALRADVESLVAW